MARKQADVVIVGVGAAGAILLRELAQAGFKVLGIDKGPYYDSEDFWLKFDELRISVRYGISPAMETDPITWRPNRNTQARVLPWAVAPEVGNPLYLPPSIGIGGGSYHYGAWHWRFHPDEFRMRSAIVERYGEQKLPEGSRIVDWPISYDDLEPYYDRVEREIGVSGQAGNINGQLIEGGNPYEGRRQRPYPFPPIRPSASNEVFAEAAKRLGYHPFPCPTAILSRDWGERKACVYCGFCRDYGCHVGAKSSTLDTMIPAALATGNVELLTHCRVQRVNVDADGRARSVSYVDARGELHEASGDLIVLSAYALENVRLLLVSGLNQNGMVGKYYMIHNYHWYFGILPEDTNPFAGPACGGWAIADTDALLMDHSHHDVVWGTPIMFFSGDIQPIEGAKNVPPDVPKWGAAYKEWLRYGYRRLCGMYSQIASLPMESNFLDLDPVVKDPWGQPALRITHDWGRHEIEGGRWINQIKAEIAREMGCIRTWEAPLAPPYHVTTHEHGGTCMGDDPDQFVVNRYCQSHEVPNLFLVSGGVFPVLGGYNPTATIQALAFWTADYIKRETRNGGTLTRTVTRAPLAE